MKKIRESNKVKKQEGITLVALVITIIIIIILATVTINMAFGDNGLIKQAELAKDMTANSTIAEQEGMNSLMDEYANLLAEDSEIPVDKLPTDGSFNAEKGVNTPNIGNNMQLVVFDKETSTWIPDETNSGYSYIDTSIEGNENKSEWANAKVTIDNIDSYFVWIPRYAYKITYYTDDTKETISSTPTIYGTIDIKFINGIGNIAADGTVCKYASEKPNATQEYVVHPAFTTDADQGGGWENELAGIWIGKYEASLVNKSDGSNIVTNDTGTGDILLSNDVDKTVATKPGYSSWRNITIGNSYTNARTYSEELKSHMLKNSEWGAVAYLTDSKYGRNGEEITINNNGTTFYTGGGADNAYITSTPQSSTGNVYGIYDLSGNTWEYVAAAYSNRSEIETISGSTKYATVYDGTEVNTDYKYGDATYETSGWHSDYADFVTSTYPLFKRGGSYVDTTAGVFCFDPIYRRIWILFVSFSTSSVMRYLVGQSILQG